MATNSTPATDKYQRAFDELAKNSFKGCFISALTCTTVQPAVVDGSVSGYEKKFSLAHLIGNILFFTAGMAAGDVIPNMLKKEKKDA